MILTELELHNFGVYRGLHRIVLTPQSGRSIVLFGGLNGAGKTTLLEAVLLALYGKRTFATKREGLPYQDYLRRCIHQAVPPSEGASVRLRFKLRVAGQLRTIRVSRVWQEARSGIREVLEVHEGEPGRETPSTHLASRWEEHVESVVPHGVAPLFFFDGDRIEELADLANSGELIRTAVHGLLGLDLIDRLSVDLEIIERRKLASTVSKSEANGSFQMAEQLVQSTDGELAAARERVRVLEARLEDTKTRVIEVEERFKREGGELYARREAIEARLSQFRNMADSLEEDMRATAAGTAPLLVVKHILEEIRTIDAEDQANEAAALVFEILEQRDQSLLRFVESAGHHEASLASTIRRFLEVDRSNRRRNAARELVLGLSRGSRSQLLALLDGQLDQVLAEIDRQRSEFEDVIERIDEIERTISGIPEAEAIAPLLDEVAEIRATRSGQERELVQAREERDYFFRQAELANRRLSAEHRKIVEREWRDRTAKRVVTFASRSRKRLAVFRKQVLLKNTERIERLVLESFQQLLRKTGMVHGLSINPDSLTVQLHGSDGHVLHPDRLSAGERQLLAVSLLWGLARASRRVIPTIVDTPLGRLDSIHRAHLVNRYFPYASHQVLLLSTDEEIAGSYLEALSMHIGRSYHLVYDDALSATHVEPGYFHKETVT